MVNSIFLKNFLWCPKATHTFRVRKEGVEYRPVFFKLELASGSPGGLVKLRVAETHSRRFWISRSGAGPHNLHF